MEFGDQAHGISSVLDESALAKFGREHRVDPHVWKRLRYLLFAEGRAYSDVIRSEIPSYCRQTFEAQFRFEILELVEQHRSELDRSLRLIFETKDRTRFESVVMHAPGGRTSLCVSSQAGCAMRCSFCATGQMGLLRDLNCDEIVGQVAQANDLLRPAGRQVRNVVFMGMGEPLHNEKAVFAALDRLLDSNQFALSPRRIIVSTVGICSGMLRLARRLPRVGLALSLHSVRPDVREELIPLARRYPLDELHRTLRVATDLLKRPIMVEYLMLDKVNDQLEDANELAKYLAGLSVHVNLIPYNPIPNAPTHFRPTPRIQRDRFAQVLRDRGFLTTIRYSQGSDIGAACGQLVHRS